MRTTLFTEKGPPTAGRCGPSGTPGAPSLNSPPPLRALRGASVSPGRVGRGRVLRTRIDLLRYTLTASLCRGHAGRLEPTKLGDGQGVRGERPTPHIQAGTCIRHHSRYQRIQCVPAMGICGSHAQGIWTVTWPNQTSPPSPCSSPSPVRSQPRAGKSDGVAAFPRGGASAAHHARKRGRRDSPT